MISSKKIKELRRHLEGFMSEGVPLAPKTAFRTGGKAAVFIEAKSLDELELALKILEQQEVGFQVIGGGSNILVADAGICDRAVIRLVHEFKDFAIVGSDSSSVMIRAASGVSLTRMVHLCSIGGYSGFENLAGIPGTLGGALAMNAGAYGSTIYDHLASLQILKGAEFVWRPRSQLDPVYRNGGLGEKEIAIAAYFLLPRKPRTKIAAQVREIKNQRCLRLPKGRHAGSIFKNPPGDFAGRLLEESGCKQMVSGGAYVTKEHANVIAVDSSAKSQDVIDLLKKMREEVERCFGVVLELEIRLF